MIALELPDLRLHIIAHSMGAEIGLSVLAELARRGPTASHPKFGELILSHADVDPGRLARVMPDIKTLGVCVTSYSSAEESWPISEGCAGSASLPFSKH